MIGQTISHYRITEKLGEGGMGVVYKAEDLKLYRDVALKFLPASLVSSPEDIARFEQEARAISTLNHPNIATIFDIDEAGGKRFLVLEYIAGGTLKSKIKNAVATGKDLSVSEVLAYGIQIAEGLAHAHRHQIIHRDVKSDNVMLTDEDKVKIADFGLAKLRGSLHLTKTGSTVGTLAYMAPEQLRGEEIDHRADLFSLGVVLYEMATSRLPFRGEHEPALLYSIANEDPVPVSSLRQNIPPALEQVITKCLQKDKTLRYQTADEIVAELRTVQHDMSQTVKTVIVKQRSKLPWIIAAGIIALGAVAVYLLMPPSHPSGPNSKTIAVLPFTNFTDQKEDEYFCDGVVDDIMAQLVKVADLKVISRTTMMQYKGTRKSLTEIGHELNAGVILEGSVRRSGNQLRIVAQLIDANRDEHLWADTYDREDKQVFAIQSEIAEKIAGSLQAKLSSPETSRRMNQSTPGTEVYNAYLEGRYFLNQRGKENVQKAITCFTRALQLDSTYARAWAGLSRAHGMQADAGYVPLHEGYLMARNEVQRALELDPNLAEAHARLGWIKMSYDWDWSGADASFKRALELEPGNASIIQSAGVLAGTLGRFDEAIALGRRAIELDPLLSTTRYNLGLYAYYAGHWEEAEASFRKALELNPEYQGAHTFLGLTYLVQSAPTMALAEIQKEPEPAWRTFALPLVYYAMGDTARSDSAIAEFIKGYQDDAAYQVAEIYAYRGETDKAFEWLERAYRQRDGGVGDMKGDPLLRSIEKDPRYAEFMKKMKLPI